MATLLDDRAISARILDHIDKGTTDLGDGIWREPVANYRSPERLKREIDLIRRLPIAFCPSAALTEPGSFLARRAAGVPLVAVRGADGVVRAFRNACRHRGAELASGCGVKKAFTCRYHGWTYALDGALRGVPHEYGFPGLDKQAHGLVPVETQEHGGMVFVTQEGDGSGGMRVDELPDLLPREWQVVNVSENDSRTNWKISAEGFLEGYHIFSTHRETFYPVQFDNLNVIETFGRNGRITFPYRNVQKLRKVASEEREVAGTLTFVYHLFPNVMVATFPQRIVVVVLEPEDVGVTRTHTYTLARQKTVASDMAAVVRDGDFVDAGAKEDRDMVESIQRSIPSEANDSFTFGRFEALIVHFHRNLHELLGADR